MKKSISFAVYAIIAFQLGCAASQKFDLKEPEPDKSLLVGAVLVENIGVEDVYDAHKENIVVVIVGKHTENGEEKIKGYRTKTDENGYFVLQNVPPGSYVLKGFEVDLAFSTRLISTSRWEGLTQIYYPISTIIDNNVRHWPPESESRIIDMGIYYFMIDASLRIFDNTFDELQNSTLELEDRSYSMPNPVTYFKQKFPEWGWFQ